ncbi:glycosyltransferase [Sphingobium estronivorans]|uniref:glycosyltransferase n=1 Tax=Sphingobium estronivorans TaxID=1577690 RepID=UPI00123A7721|nr:glycosyltransferase [Sphingobium estronivorans]
MSLPPDLHEVDCFMKSSLKQLVDIVKNSELFDDEWYNEKYPDAYFSNMDAAEHYFRVGWKLGRDPSPNFNTKEFIAQNKSLFQQGVCPVVAFESSKGGSVKAAAKGGGKRGGSSGSPGKRSEITVVEQSPLFDAQWYREQYPEAGESDRDAAWHYLTHGAKHLLNPGPRFSTRFYLHKYPDIAKAGINPLVHYEKFGRVEGRPILPAYLDRPETDPAVTASARPREQGEWTDAAAAARYLVRQLHTVMPGEPVRMFQNFDVPQAERFVAALDLCAGDDVAHERVSVIMPTYNRATKIATAINSVLAQSWANFELIIVDDGSTDHTPEVLATYDDPRIKVLHSQRGGVSGARNTGLRAAMGEVIFYLDSDNEWTPDFLWIMMQSMRHSGASCGYAATRLQSLQGNLIGYRGEPFDWEACLALNYVDMNVFCHRRDVSDRLGGFDTGLRRMVDWDLILRFTRDVRVFYAPVIGCIYIEDSADLNRITTSEPIVSWKLVHDKNALNYTLQEVVGQLRFNIAIKIFAPYQDRDAWGDFHYAESLAEALEALGHRVRIDFRGQWYAQPVSADDVAIVLRGLEAYVPRPTQISLFWGISHPDTVPLQEYDAYQGVFIASRSYAELLEMLLHRQVHTMWQSTDASRFFPPAEQTEAAIPSFSQGIFIGNSRREYRQIVRWAVEAGLPLDVIGQDWDSYLPKDMIRATNAPNKELAALYGSASFVLNDHWTSMRDFGYVSNRVFDVLAAGGQLISDKLASIEALFGDAVISVSSAEELSLAVSGGAMNRDKVERHRLSENVRQQHGFAQRAATFDSWLRNYIVPSIALADAGAEEEWGHRVRVGVLACWSKPELLDMAIERIVAPLTCDVAATQLRLLRVETGEDLLEKDLDVLVIASESCRWNADIHAAIVSRMEQGLPVFLDAGSAPVPEEMASLLPELAGLWCDSEASARALARKDVTIITPRLDPRLWRLYRSPRPIEAEQGVTRLLVLSGTGAAWQNQAMSQALADLEFDETVSLRIIGMEWDGLSVQLWRSCEPWPENCVGYARRARWLLDNITADIGIILNDAANGDSQILHMMALGIVPVVIAPAPGSLARCGKLAGLVEICEEHAELPGILRRLMKDPAHLLARRSQCVERLWQDYNTLNSPDPRLPLIVAAPLSTRSEVPA